MSALTISLITVALVFSGAVLGMHLRNLLPEGHLGDDVKDVIRLSTGLIGTIAALVLGLLIASAKSSYDASDSQIKQITSKIILLDSLLEQYGPDARSLRVTLRSALGPVADRIWNEGDTSKAPFEATAQALAFVNQVQELKPDTEVKHALQSRVVNAIGDLSQSRLSLFVEAHDAIPMPFVVILIFWITMIFTSFGLFVRPNPTVFVTFAVGALSVSAAIFLILEMDRPYSGLLQISSEPLRHALASLPP